MNKIKEEGAGGISASIVLDSSRNGKRLTTIQLKYPRLIHSEFMTHRVFSRNASSSRAIPVQKVIDQVISEPAMPIHWGSNQPGMQAGSEVPPNDIQLSKQLWVESALKAVKTAESMMEIGLHKQVANRILEPYQFMHVVVSATEWDNFFKLRLHPDADPNIFELARVMKGVMTRSIPDKLAGEEWHLPYISQDESRTRDNELLIKASVARCARVSYLNHDKSTPDFEKDVSLHNMLLSAGHMSPFEHVAVGGVPSSWYGNFQGWKQYRKML